MSSLAANDQTRAQSTDEIRILAITDEGKQHVPYSDKQYVPFSDKQVAFVTAGQPLMSADYYAQEHYNSKAQAGAVVYEKGIDEPRLISDGTKEKRRPVFGSRCCLTSFIVAAILISFVIIGGAVGGSMARKSSKSSHTTTTGLSATDGGTSIGVKTATATSTKPTSTSTPTPTSTPGFGAYDCPTQNGTTYESSIDHQPFEILCDADWPTGVAGLDGDRVVDLNNGVHATSIESCIDICAANKAGGGTCTAVAYGANITLALSRGGITGNCFMKSQRGVATLPDGSHQAMAAFLVSTRSTPPIDTGLGSYNCPAQNGTTHQASTSTQNYEILCDSDWPNNIAGFNGGLVIDLDHGVYATSIESCIDICAANHAGEGACTAVAYGANITLALSRGGITGNCFMKTQRGAATLLDTSGQAMTAFLISG